MPRCLLRQYSLICVVSWSPLFHLTATSFFFSLQVDFDLRTKWPEYTYIYLYEMFYKAEVLKNDHNFFRPVSQLKTSVIVWYLLNPVPPSQSVSHLTASQAKSIWGLTDDELEANYHESHRGLCYLFWCHFWVIVFFVFVNHWAEKFFHSFFFSCTTFPASQISSEWWLFVMLITYCI